MVITDHNEVWWPEVFLVRLPITIYTGWISSATILNTTYMLKSLGMNDPGRPTSRIASDLLSFMMVMTEENYTFIIVWVAGLIYNLACWEERNPVYGMVFMWALSAILDNAIKKGLDLLTFNGGIVLGVHTASMLTLMGYLLWEEL